MKRFFKYGITGLVVIILTALGIFAVIKGNHKSHPFQEVKPKVISSNIAGSPMTTQETIEVVNPELKTTEMTTELKTTQFITEEVTETPTEETTEITDYIIEDTTEIETTDYVTEDTTEDLQPKLRAESFVWDISTDGPLTDMINRAYLHIYYIGNGEAYISDGPEITYSVPGPGNYRYYWQSTEGLTCIQNVSIVEFRPEITYVDDKIICPLCDRTFDTEDDYIYHYNQHNEYNEFNESN